MVAGVVSSATGVALLQCVGLSLAFVGVAPLCRALLGASGPSSGQHTLRRDEPLQIVARIAGTAVVCAFAWIPLWLALGARSERASALLALLGLRQASPGQHLRSSALACGLACLLLLGVFVDRAADALKTTTTKAQRRPWIGGGGRRLQDLRDYAAAPVAEEFVFRACMVPLLALGGLGGAAALSASSLIFGLAHAQHLAEFCASSTRRLRRDDLAAVGTQVAFTSVFGYLAGALFLATGSLAACVAAHVTCNLLGAPDFARLGAATAASAEDRRYAVLTWAGLVAALALAAFATRAYAWDYQPLAAASAG